MAALIRNASAAQLLCALYQCNNDKLELSDAKPVQGGEKLRVLLRLRVAEAPKPGDRPKRPVRHTDAGDRHRLGS